MAIHGSSPGQATGLRAVVIGALQFAKLLTGPAKLPPNHDVLFVASPSDITTPSEQGLISLYLHPLYLACQDLGLSSLVVLHPNVGKMSEKSLYQIESFPRIKLPRILRATSLAILRGRFWWKSLEQELREVVRNESPSWRDVLFSISPKLVIGIGLTDDICKAAHDAQIPTIEVQHGFFVEMPRYWQRYFPDYFLSWDPESQGKAVAAGLESIVGGHPFDFVDSVSSGRVTLNSPPVCCVTISWDERETADSFGSMTHGVLKAAKEFQSTGVTLVIRLHPVMAQLPWRKAKRYVKALKKLLPGAIIENPRKVALLDSIIACDFGLTESSSTAIDFALLGKATVVINEKAREALLQTVRARGLPEDSIRANAGIIGLPYAISSEAMVRSGPNLKLMLSKLLPR